MAPVIIPMALRTLIGIGDHMGGAGSNGGRLVFGEATLLGEPAERLRNTGARCDLSRGRSGFYCWLPGRFQ